MLEILGSYIINFISSTGYFGVFILMTLESALIPIPSEITMPFAGSLVPLDKFNFWLIVLAGTVGNLAGSLLAYALGFWGGENVVRIVIRKYGKYVLVSEHEFDNSTRLFTKYGELIVFFSRLLPVIRTFISLPAGIARMNLTKFIVYSTVGAAIWSIFLTYIGVTLGKNWSSLESYFRKFDLLIVFLGVLLAGAYFYHKLKKLKKIT